MVAKRLLVLSIQMTGYLLAKIHMVAKLDIDGVDGSIGYLLAKIHMVAKLYLFHLE